MRNPFAMPTAIEIVVAQRLRLLVLQLGLYMHQRLYMTTARVTMTTTMTTALDDPITLGLTDCTDLPTNTSADAAVYCSWNCATNKPSTATTTAIAAMATTHTLVLLVQASPRRRH